jgi:hypothetical protein
MKVSYMPATAFMFPLTKQDTSVLTRNRFVRVLGMVCSVVLPALGTMSNTHAQSKNDQATELRQKIAQLQSLRLERIEIQQQLTDQNSKRHIAADRLGSQVQELKKRTAEAQLQNEALVKQIDSVKQQTDADMQWLTSTSQDALKATSKIHLSNTNTPETNALLQNAITQLADQSKRQLDESHKSYDGIINLTKWLQTQRQQARRIELSSQTISLSQNRVIHAYVLQIGTVARYLASEDYSELGYQTANGWQTSLTETQKQNISQAIAMLRGKVPPALLALPFAPEKAGE